MVFLVAWRSGARACDAGARRAGNTQGETRGTSLRRTLGEARSPGGQAEGGPRGAATVCVSRLVAGVSRPAAGRMAPGVGTGAIAAAAAMQGGLPAPTQRSQS
jgi:hypothetical protein